MQESVTSMLTYSVRELLENEEDVKNNLLVCPICSQLVIEPKECSECQNLFCDDCIKSWLKKSQQCPFKCPNKLMQLKDPHRFVKNTIANLILKCPNHLMGCDKKITNEKLQNHINEECQFTIFKCPNEGCDLKFNKVDIKQHQLQCEARIINCENCGTKYKSKNNHDCLKEALSLIKQLKLDIEQIQKDNYQTKVELLSIIQKQGEDIKKLQNQILIGSYVCKNHHKLQWTAGCRGKCSQCNQSNAMLRFKCEQCKMIYCEKCKPCYLLNKKCPSGHELVYQQSASLNIECDFCLSHPALKNIPNWRDRDCDFDACNDCYKKYSI